VVDAADAPYSGVSRHGTGMHPMEDTIGHGSDHRILGAELKTPSAAV
jgi:hypothetical protein